MSSFGLLSDTGGFTKVQLRISLPVPDRHAGCLFGKFGVSKRSATCIGHFPTVPIILHVGVAIANKDFWQLCVNRWPTQGIIDHSVVIE